MSYRELLRRLEPVCGLSEARAVLRMVFSRRYGLSWTDVLCDDFSRLSPAQIADVERVVRRLERAEPVQYVLGEAEFCGRSFVVNPSVLIPRPETEDLVALVRRSIADARRVLDIGTGSGCIAITLAADRSDWRVTGFDLLAAALATARENAVRLGVGNVDFVCRDILDRSLDTADNWDAIVSNPPYVLEEERHGMAANVLRYEPEVALFVPDDRPLLFYDAILAYARTALRRGGRLFFEVNTRFARSVGAALEAANYTDIRIEQDRFARDRFVVGTKQ